MAQNEDNQVAGSGGTPAGLSEAQIATLVGQIIVTAGGVVEEVIRVEGNRVTGSSGQQYDLATILALQNQQQQHPPAPPAQQNWIPWAVGGGLLLAVVLGMGRR